MACAPGVWTVAAHAVAAVGYAAAHGAAAFVVVEYASAPSVGSVFGAVVPSADFECRSPFAVLLSDVVDPLFAGASGDLVPVSHLVSAAVAGIFHPAWRFPYLAA